jgi:hypothetical protein
VARAHDDSFKKAMRLMRKHDPMLREEGFATLSAHAGEWLPLLVAELENEQRDRGLRAWLLELIGHSGSSDALPVLARYLDDDDESLRGWAERGLRDLDTREARRLLWNAGRL